MCASLGLLNREKLAANEALFRDLNEQVLDADSRFSGPGDEPSPYIQFLCECSRTECVEQIELTTHEYESVRAEPTQFALAPGHDNDAIERVILQTERYVVVDKFVAEEFLEQADPRS